MGHSNQIYYLKQPKCYERKVQKSMRTYKRESDVGRWEAVMWLGNLPEGLKLKLRCDVCIGNKWSVGEGRVF